MWIPPIHQVDVLLRKKSVNNDRIYRDVDALVMAAIRDDLSSLQSVTAQMDMAELIEEYIIEYMESEESMYGVEVFCDARNNSRDDCDEGKIHLTVKYRQQNCLNITELVYEITF